MLTFKSRILIGVPFGMLFLRGFGFLLALAFLWNVISARMYLLPGVHYIRPGIRQVEGF
jgi:hypothetical protein